MNVLLLLGACGIVVVCMRRSGTNICIRKVLINLSIKLYNNVLKVV